MPAQRELRSLVNERDPESLIQGLAGLAERLDQRGRHQAAGALYALAGRERPDSRLENFLQNLVEQASDPAMIAGMAVGGVVFRATRLFTLSRLAGSALPAGLSRGLGSRLFAATLATAAEAPVFTATVRASNQLLGRSQDWSRQCLFREFASGALLMASLRVGGGISGGILSNWNPAAPGLSRRAAASALPAGTSLAAIMLSHRLEAEWGWRQPSQGWDAFGEALATWVNLQVGGRVAHGLMGESFRVTERAWDQRSERLLNSSDPFWRNVLRDAAFVPLWWMMGAGLGGGFRPPRGAYRGERGTELGFHEAIFS
ncbi:MAG TPA: hypothetical protein VFW62_04825, partial [bacterium]|nr:hypothetical protein [bacterium]